MLRCMAAIVIGGYFLAGCSSTSDTGGSLRSDYPLADLAWLAGSWRSVEQENGHTVISEEHWTDGTGGTMFGVNRLIADDRTVFFEYLRIEADEDGRSYIAQPRGRAPGTRFRLVELAEGQVAFENPEHDFPQRIMYRREGDTLHARIEGEQDGETRGETWQWERVGDDE